MPPIIPAYEWSQDAAAITLSIPLKGTKAALVDLFAASTYVKVSFGRYLLELDLLRPIDDRAVTAAARQGVLIVTLPKAKASQHDEPWPSLTLPTAEQEVDKQAVRERRAAAVAEHRAAEQGRAEAAQERRAELEQAAFRAQMAAQERARQAAEAQAMQEKRDAEAALLGGAAAPAPPLPPPKPAASVPPPRVMREATVRVRFTPRAFPTPARESKAAEEEAWLSRNRPSSSSLPPKRDAGSDEGCEAHPVFLKAKGDELFKAQDFAGALNAYRACLAVDPTHGGAVANRAACHLKLRRWDDCVADCTWALGLLPPPEGSSSNGNDNNKARMRLLARRGTAYYEKGMYAEALEDYQAALRASPAGERDEALVKDVAKLRGLVGGGGGEEE